MLGAGIRRPLPVLVGLYVVLATLWNFVTPPLESPDEDAHVEYVLLVADQARLPDLRIDGARVGNEYFQPPLYYVAMASVLKLSGMPHSEPAPTRVPGWDWDTVPANYFEVTPERLGYLHLLREVSALFGVVTVICTYLAATLLGASGWLRTSATTASAALPQFTYISATVNPDSLAVALASLGVVLLLLVARSLHPPRRLVAAFGAVTAAGTLTEYHVLYILVLAVLAYAFVLDRPWRAMLRDGGLALATFVACAGPWLVWDLARYNGPPPLASAPVEYQRTLLDPYFIFFFPRILYESFLGAYGWLNVYLPSVWYVVFAMLWLGALWGIIHGTVVTHGWPAERKMLVLAPLLILGLVLYRNLGFNAPQGRYFFVALPAISCLFGFGLAELPGRLGRGAVITAGIFLIAANLYSLWLVWHVFARA